MIKAMREKFSRDPQEVSDVALMDLTWIKQKEGEPMESYESRVTQLVYQAYPYASNQERERQAVLAFSHGIFDTDIRRKALERRFNSLKKLQGFIRRCQLAEKVERSVLG